MDASESAQHIFISQSKSRLRFVFRVEAHTEDTTYSVVDLSDSDGLKKSMVEVRVKRDKSQQQKHESPTMLPSSSSKMIRRSVTVQDS